MNRIAALAAVVAISATAANANPCVLGGARFTVITPECIRLEFHPEGRFVDAPSMFAVGREARASEVTEDRQGGRLVLDTGRMRLTYTPDGKPFSETNLRVEISGPPTIAWTPASRQTRNLGGTINTLDQVKGPVPLHDGILSRDGWFLLDDSNGHLLVDGWVARRPEGSGTDWYLFGYGTDFPAAFRAFSTIGGPVPMPRKPVLGSWYSRWWHYTTKDYKDIVREYARHDFPLDVIVMDMEWHTGPWTGWSWNRELLDDPPALLRWFRRQGLAVTLNVHPADGVAPTEDMYKEFMADLGEDTDTTRTVEFDAGNRRYMETLFRHTHHPREAEGVDFWWLDWQQYPEVKSVPGLLNLSWLNKLYFDNSMRTGRRGLQFSRWGAWGDHRHPIHFSGDADTGWAMLGFEVPFTSTAANEGAYFWSHDIGGHFGDRNEEPYTRWVQFAATTAAMRLHSGIIPYLDRRPWKWPDWATKSMRRSFHLRSELMPYIYSAVRQTHETALPLNRPMYVAYPRDEEAYQVPQQFLFGSDLLVAPIASPGHGPGRVASQLVWFPAGEWRDFFTGESFTGPQWRLVCADIDEFPLYARAGVPIPTQPYSPRPTTAPLDKLVVRVFPAADDVERSSELYEDDGDSREYEGGRFAKTKLTARSVEGRFELTIGATFGEFDNQPRRRAYEFHIEGVGEPTRVLVNGRSAKATWSAENQRATIRLRSRDIRVSTSITVEAPAGDPALLARRALQRRVEGVLGPGRGGDDLVAALREAALANSPELPALAALSGVGVIENGTHYPQVGTLVRLVRNADSTADPDSFNVTWTRTVTRREPVETKRTSTPERGLNGPRPIAAPEWSSEALGFMENSVDRRSVTFRVGAQEANIGAVLKEVHGRIPEWHVSPVYPFDKNIDIARQPGPPESLTLDQLAAPAKLDGWIVVQPGENGVVDLGKARGGENCVAHATATVTLPRSADALLRFRSDDGIEAWVNGRKVHSKHIFRGIDHPWEDIPVRLEAGRNVLLIKVSQGDGGWGFVMVGEER